MVDVVTSIIATPAGAGLLEVVGSTKFSDGREVDSRAKLTKDEYDAARQIARSLVTEIPMDRSGANSDGSNILTGMHLALIRLHAMGIPISSMATSTAGYEAARRAAVEHRSRPHYELADSLTAAIASATTGELGPWTQRTKVTECDRSPSP